MAVNVKLGSNTITGVSSVKLESADTAGTYETFSLGAGAPFQNKTIRVAISAHTDMGQYPSFPCSVTLSFVANTAQYSGTPKTLAETTITFNSSEEFDIFKDVTLDMSEVSATGYNEYTSLWVLINTSDFGQLFNVKCQRVQYVDFANEHFPVIDRGTSYGSTYDRVFYSSPQPSYNNNIVDLGNTSSTRRLADSTYLANSEVLVSIDWKYYED